MKAFLGMSSRAEKTVRLVSACVVGSALGIPAVILDSEALGYAAVGILGAAILVGPVIERARLRHQG